MRKSFAALVHKEVLHFLRDPRTLLIALMIPLVQMILFGFAISTEINHIDVSVAAPKITSSIEAKVSQIAHNPYVTFKGYVSTAEVRPHLAANKALAVVVFAEDYDKTGKSRIVLDASNPTTAQTAAGYLSQMLSASEGSSLAPGVVFLYNPQLKSAYNFVPGIMGMIFMLICAMLTSVSIVREKECGTLEPLLVSPLRPTTIVLAKMTPYFALTVLDLTLMLAVAKFALGLSMSGSMGALLAASFVYLLLSLALGLLVSTLVKTQMAALLVSGMVFVVPVVMLSGMIFPTENMPVVLQWISTIVPARWYIPVLRKTMVEGLGFDYMTTELSVLVTMTLLLTVVSIKRFKNRLL